MMEEGGNSNKSVAHILSANLDVMKTWRRLGQASWPFAPLVKMGSKLGQLRF